jgi:uncharacterized protein (TIGR03067 family)
MPLPLACVALLSLAFAPAPFPKQERRGQTDEITLDTFQGSWRVTNMQTSQANGQHVPYSWNVTHIRVAKDRWTFMQRDAEVSGTYISIDHTKRPALVNFYSQADQKGVVSGVGLIRRQGPKVQVLYRWGDEKNRPLTFEPPPEGPWIITLERDK